MRRPMLYSLVAVIAVLAIATAVLFARYRNTTDVLANTKVQQQQAESRYARTIDAITEIQDSLNAISAGETKVEMMSGGLRAERSANGRQALDQIELLRASISRNKQRINQLESSLHKSGIRVAGLQKMIKTLKESVTEKEQLVAQLNVRVDSLQTQVTGLATTVQQTQDTLHVRDQTLEDRRKELATVYYIMGNKTTLRKSGVITAKGGVLGVGKTLTPTGKPNESIFTPLDTDQQTVVEIPSAKVRVLSAQPPSSYELRIIGKRSAELHILDPHEFRKVKDVVIVTA